MPYVAPGLFMVGVDLHAEVPSLAALVGTPVRLKYKDRERVTVIEQVEPPVPNHLPPYRAGERIGIRVRIAQEPSLTVTDDVPAIDSANGLPRPKNRP
jgi:hypothetical protein